MADLMTAFYKMMEKKPFTIDQESDSALALHVKVKHGLEHVGIATSLLIGDVRTRVAAIMKTVIEHAENELALHLHVAFEIVTSHVVRL